MSPEWFSGQAGGPTEEAVLAAVRQLAVRRGLRGVRAEHTHASTPLDWPLMLTVQVPELRALPGAPELQVGVDFAEEQLHIWGGWETFGFALDSGVDVLNLAPEPPQPAAVAEAVHSWMQTQLARPVLQDEWKTLTGRTRRSWRFGDDGSRIAADPWASLIERRRAPDRVVTLR